jgi:hypothetical protein
VQRGQKPKDGRTDGRRGLRQDLFLFEHRTDCKRTAGDVVCPCLSLSLSIALMSDPHPRQPHPIRVLQQASSCVQAFNGREANTVHGGGRTGREQAIKTIQLFHTLVPNITRSIKCFYSHLPAIINRRLISLCYLMTLIHCRVYVAL